MRLGCGRKASWYCMSYRCARSATARSRTGRLAVPTEMAEKSNSMRWKKRGTARVSSVNWSDWRRGGGGAGV